MAQVSITQLPQAQALTGTESVPIVQNGVTVQTTTGAISGAGALNYPFLTVGSTAGLPQARYLSTSSGLSATDNGAGSTLQINLTGAALSLDSSSTGLQVKTGPNTLTGRSLAVGAGLGVTNPDGVSGDPTVSLGSFLSNFVSLTGTGVLAIQSGSVGKIDVLGTTNQISIVNGNGAGNITVEMASNPVIPGVGALTIPVGTTGDRPTPAVGQIRYNSTVGGYEAYQPSGWQLFSLAGGVTQVDTGTGLLGGPITSIGTISIDTSVVATANNSLTLANKTLSGLNNTLSDIGNSSLVNSGITINGSSVSLGGAITVTATASNALTIGTGLSGTSFNGSSPVTIAIDGTVATLTGTQTFTNKSISGATNTLSSIPNSALTNSSITLGSTSVALGASSATLAGLTSVAVTQPPTAALQLATKQYVDDAVSSGITIHAPVRVETPTALTATYTPGGTAVTATDIVGGTTLTFSTSPSLSVNDQIVFSSTSNGIVAGTAYYVFSVPAANQVTLSLSYSGPEITTLTNGTGLTIAGTVNAGVGATLTNAGAKAAIQIDGITLSLTNRVLVYNQANAFENGVYTVTTVGTPDPGGTNWVLTRASTEDTFRPDSTSGLGQGDYFFVQEGLTGAGESYVLTTSNPIIIGTTNLTFTQFSASQAYSAGTGLTLTGTTFSITNTGVSAATYGSASSVPAIAVNAQGQITSASNTAIAINGNQITSGTIDPAYGGTGLTSYTAGDLLYASGTTALSKLAIGTVGQVLTSTGSAPQYVAQSTLSVGSATNTSITANSTNATNYLTFVSATTGNLPQLVNSSITCNPGTGQITGGIAGGAF